MADFFDELINNKKRTKTVVDELYTVPKRDNRENAPTFQVRSSGLVQQADLLSLPHDKHNNKTYKYALVVVDDHSKKCDAEPLTSKLASEVLKGFEAIYKRDVLKLPKIRIEVDAGSEFKGVVAEYFKKHNVTIRVADTGRHRQQGIVERRNQLIGQYLFQKMTAQELLTGETSRHWVEDLPKLVAALNKKATATKVSKDILPKGDLNILKLGSIVRIQLDEPKEVVNNAKLHGKFRKSDIRFSTETYTIDNILLKPNQPVLYRVKGKNPAYTRNQLLVVKNQQLPNPESVIVGNPNTYIVDAIEDSKTDKGKKYYLVKWRGYPDATWEPRANLIVDVPDIVNAYERKQK